MDKRGPSEYEKYKRSRMFRTVCDRMLLHTDEPFAFCVLSNNDVEHYKDRRYKLEQLSCDLCNEDTKLYKLSWDKKRYVIE